MLKLLDTILGYLFPTKCIICDRPGPDVCDHCLASFEPAKPSNYDWIFSLWNYRDHNVEILMRHIKNQPNVRIAQQLAHVIEKRFGYKMTNTTMMVPIPVGRARLRTRGYNQAQLLARPLATLLHLPITSVLIKSKQTKKQGTTKTRTERLENIKGSFALTDPSYIFNQTIMIIDDITTTGTTLLEARTVLLQDGAKEVFAITIAN